MNMSAINNTNPSSSSSISRADPSPMERSRSISSSTTNESSSSHSSSLSNINNALKTFNNFINSNNMPLSAYVDNSSGKAVFKVIDTSNLELISQMPSEQALAMARVLGNNTSIKPTGMLVKNQA